MKSLLIEQLQHCDKLPSIPAIAQKVIARRQDPDTDFNSVAAVLQQDPAIAAQLLKWANSPYYGQERQCTTVIGAVRLFGIHPSLTIALNFSLVDNLRAMDKHSLNYIWFWRCALLAGTFARKLAKYLGHQNEEEAFLAALLQNIGMIALDQVIPDLYGNIMDTHDYHQAAHQLERDSIHSNHAVVGAWLLERWGLPEALISAVARSHDFKLTKRCIIAMNLNVW